MNFFRRFFVLLLALGLNSCLWQDSKSADVDGYLPIDDSEYPYAGWPRLVIETENFRTIRNRTVKVPARVQLYGEDSPMSEVFELTVRGRGNSSYHVPKYGLKLEFQNKVSFFGMPRNRDWALQPNYGDKTYLRNFIGARLSEKLGARYTPRTHYVELFLNREYRGLYLLSENVKVGKNRVNIAEHDSSFLLEKEDPVKYDEPSFKTNDGHIIHVQSPKNLSQKSLELVQNHLNDFEAYIHRQSFHGQDSIESWLDLDDFLLYYWVQEFSKNEDGNFTRSIFFSWKKGGTIHFGPLWDLDLGFGNQSREKNQSSDGWYVRNAHWFRYILEDQKIWKAATEFWENHRETFRELIDSIPFYQGQISDVVKRNELKRWPILDNTYTWALRHSYSSYEEAVDSMKVWMERRFTWIEERLSDP